MLRSRPESCRRRSREDRGRNRPRCRRPPRRARRRGRNAEGGQWPPSSSSAPLPSSLLREYRPFRRLPRELPEGLRQVLSIVEKEHTPRPLLHQKGDQWGVGLGRVAVAAGQDQVVGAVVGGLPTPGPYMVQGDDVWRGLGPAVGTHWAVLAQEPLAVRLH